MIPSTITVLVVESDVRRSLLLVKLLERSLQPSVRLHVVATFGQALECLEETPCDVVVSRLKLPGTKGLEVLVRLQAYSEAVSVIALLEDDEKDVVLDAAQSLADDCLFYGDLNAEKLSQSILLAIDRREMLRDLRQRQSSRATANAPYKTLLHHFDEAILLVSRPTGELLFYNEAARAWFGDNVGDEVADLLEYGVLTGEDFEMEIVTSNPKIPNAELRSVKLTWRGQLCCMLSLRNISKRKRAEEAYRASQRRLELALKASNVGMWSWDLREQQAHFSDEWKAQLGYQRHEFPNTIGAFKKALHPEDKQRAVSQFRSVLKGDRRDFECTFGLRHANGRYRKILCRAEVFPDSKGRLAMVLGTHIDITDRFEAARDGVVTAEVARKTGLADQLVSRLETLARSVEEEAASIRSQFRGDSPIVKRIQSLEAQACRLAALHGLVAASRHSPAELPSGGETCDVTEIARVIRSLLPPQTNFIEEQEPGFSFPLVPASELSLLLGLAAMMVSDKLSQDFGSTVRLRTVQTSDARGRKRRVIEIGYAGLPISEAELEALPVYGSARFDCVGQNDGYALRLVEMASESESSRGGTERSLALLAEDEGVLKMAVRSMLESLGFEVEVAENGREAIELFTERPFDFSVALVDLHMPRIDGEGVVACIRSQRKDLPIIKMSGDDQDSVSEAFGLEDGPCCFLAKPFGAADLRRALNEVLSGVAASV